MPQDWEINWEDYYKILQVHPSAEPEIIEAAYRKLAQKYHPDTNKDLAAEERMKKINLAHEVLSNPEKRKQYDAEWFRKSDFTGKSSSPRPKPVVDPQYIRFDNVRPGEIQTSSFTIRNVGGPYAKIWVNNPDSWLKVVGYNSLTDSDELPLQVNIEAKGDDWGKSYSEMIRVKLDEEETQVRADLRTKPAPLREKATSGSRQRTNYTSPPPPPVTSRHGVSTWGRWVFGLAILGLTGVLILIFGVWGGMIPTTAFDYATIWVNHNLPGERKLPDTGGPYPSNYFTLKPELIGSKTIGGQAWAVAYYGVDIQSHYPGRYYFPGTGYIIYSSNGGKKWEVQKEVPDFKPRTSSDWFLPVNKNGIFFISEKEGYVVGDTGILYTNDGGKYWEFRKPPSGIERVEEVEFLGPHHLMLEGYYLEYNNEIRKKMGNSFNNKKRYYGYFDWIEVEYESFDGGKTWQFVKKLQQ